MISDPNREECHETIQFEITKILVSLTATKTNQHIEHLVFGTITF
jgi:hypothetical protein